MCVMIYDGVVMERGWEEADEEEEEEAAERRRVSNEKLEPHPARRCGE